MKFQAKLLLVFFVVAGLITGCSKDKYNAEKQAGIDDGLIVDFIKKNNISATKHSSGLYYQIITPGTGDFKINASSTVTVNYEGKLLDGSVFDKSKQAITFSLSQVIKGWTIGIPLIQPGGRIRLLIPSTLAYGNESPGSGIPKNSVLDFTVDLISVK